MGLRGLVAVVAVLATGIVGGFAAAAYLQPDSVTTGAPSPVVARDPSIPVDPPAPVQEDPTQPALETGLPMRDVSVGSGNNEFVFPAPVGWQRAEPNSNEVKYKVPDNPGNTFVLRVEQVTSQDQTIPEIVQSQEDTMQREFDDYELIRRTYDSLEFSYLFNGYRRFGFMTWMDDVADARIVAGLTAGDLVVTADIPLAAQAVAAKAFALNPRGTFYTADNVQDHLARRNFMESLRSAGEQTRGPPALSKTDIQAFANELDKFLTRQHA